MTREGDVITRESVRVCFVHRETPTRETEVRIIITAQFQQMCFENAVVALFEMTVITAI